MSLSPGTRVGPYEVLALLGAGGMGEVYRARDTKLGRDVAIKSLPAGFHDQERVARLQREAQILASLNHPHIAAIYGLEQVGDVHWLVLELVEGETLAQLIHRGPLSLEEALPIARQVADGLEAAHERGIIHRDLKPANIALTREGQVKILDFGLAKAIDPTNSASLSMSPTMSLAATQAGVILGTAAYMSPEQARGRLSDKRTDVWAFGCVLFEMLSGKRAFEGEDVTDIIAAVVRADPNWSVLPPGTPEHIRLLITRCLEKDRRARVADISVARFLMDEGASAVSHGPALARVETTGGASVGRRIVWSSLGLVAGIALTALATGLVVGFSPRDSLAPVRFTITPSPQPLLIQGNDRDLVITPDGRRIVYMAGTTNQPQLMVRDLESLEARTLATGIGARQPFVSADGRWIGYFTNEGLKKVAIDGGPSIALCAVDGAPRGAAWSEDDIIVFATTAPESGLFKVSANGGEPEVLTTPDRDKELDHAYPAVLPGGRSILMTVMFGSSASTNRIELLDVASGARRVVIAAGTQPSYASTGHLLYMSGTTLHAVAFDAASGQVAGDPVPVAEQVRTFPNGVSEYAIASNASLVFVTGTTAPDADPRALVWVDRRGREEAIDAPPRAYTIARISPNGARAALDIRDRTNDIWTWDFARRTLTPLSFTPGLDMNPVWTRDGHRLVWASVNDAGTPNLVWQSADGTGSPARLTNAVNAQFPTSISPDGTLFLFEGAAGSLQMDIRRLTLSQDDAIDPAKVTTEPIVATSAVEISAEISPDGRWLAYQSDKSGQPEIFVSPYPEVNGGLWQVSPAGGTRPVWAASGHELFYLDAKGMLTVVPVDTKGSAFVQGNAQRLLQTAYVLGTSSRGFELRGYDVSPDGQRFLMIKETVSTRPAPSMSMTVVLAWADELRALARPRP